jgi:uncharacterized protein (DUF952 family)
VLVFHIALRASWEAAVRLGTYEAESLGREGFIHCSTAAQYLRVAQRFYRTSPDLVLIGIETERLTSPVRFDAADGEMFPHIYGPVELDAVFDIAPLEHTDDGDFVATEAEFFVLHGERTLDRAVSDARGWMSGFSEPWWIAGGWAIDCAIGQRTRPRADLEVAIMRSSVPALAAHLRGRDVRAVAGAGTLVPWRESTLPPEIHQVWVRRGTAEASTWPDFARDPTMIDVLIDDGDGHRWSYRRNSAITLPLDRIGAQTASGAPYIRPEVQLLYKAKYLRWKDERDFSRAIPVLDGAARSWLRDALTTAHGEVHPWIARLD